MNRGEFPGGPLPVAFPPTRVKVSLMPSITSYLITEHAVFSALFDEIERSLADTQSTGEVNRLARLVGAVLTRHRDIEADLAYAALDQQLAERGELDQLHRDHEEIDANLQQAWVATDRTEATRLLKAALKNSRAHFRREEQSVFPLFEKVFQPGSLEALGSSTVQSYLAGARGRAKAVQGVARAA